jgi:manganese/iron transport system ATP-binding protein
MDTPRQWSIPALTGRGVPHQADAHIVEVSSVTVRYNGRTVLEDVNFHLTPGERVAVVGPNGAGKSTLFKVLVGMVQPTAGVVSVFGHRPGGHICIAYVPQRSQVDWTFPVNVADVVMMGRVGRLGPLRWPKAADWAYVRQCLEVVGITDLADRQISELSGGQQQRMFIARALAQEAELMLMDEPLTGLDLRSQEDTFRVLETLRQRDVTVLIATHDLGQAADRFDRVMLLNRRILGLGTADEVFTPEQLVAAYGGHLRLIHTDQGTLVLGDTCCDGEDELT